MSEGRSGLPSPCPLGCLEGSPGTAVADCSVAPGPTLAALPVELELFSPVCISEKALLRLLSPPGVVQELKFEENNASPQSTATSSSSCRYSTTCHRLRRDPAMADRPRVCPLLGPAMMSARHWVLSAPVRAR